MEGMKTLNEEEKETIVRLATNNSRYKHKYVTLVRKRFHSDFDIFRYISIYLRKIYKEWYIQRDNNKKKKVTKSLNLIFIHLV